VTAIAPRGIWLQEHNAAGIIETTSIRERRGRVRLLLGRMPLPASAVRTNDPPNTAECHDEPERGAGSRLQHRRPKDGDDADLSDEQLVAAFQCGSQPAFQTLYCRHYQKAQSLALSLTRDDDDAREIVQEAFIRVLCKGCRFEGQAAFYTWLYRIVYNLAIDRMRRPYRKPVPIELIQEQLGDLAPPGLSALRVVDPFDACSTMQAQRRIVDAIQRLPSHHRDVIIMREMYGMSYSEMACALRCSKGTIMSRLFHARRRLQGLLRWLHEEYVDATSQSHVTRSIPPSPLQQAARD
jgi:RNA polymerase sigma-70 factor, ECF subfamily